MKKSEWNKLDLKTANDCKEDKNYTCEVCGRRKADGWQMHYHHFIGRTKTALRWVMQNIFVVCVVCHNRFEEDPQWAIQTAKEMRGIKWYNLIEKIKNKICKKTYEENLYLMDKSLEEILKSYK